MSLLCRIFGHRWARPTHDHLRDCTSRDCTRCGVVQIWRLYR